MNTESKKPTDVMNTIMAFIEWLENKKNFILIIDDENNENNICAIYGDKGRMINTIANGMLQHDDLHHIVFKAATAVVKYKMQQLMEKHASADDIEKNIGDLLFGNGF